VMPLQKQGAGVASLSKQAATLVASATLTAVAATPSPQLVGAAVPTPVLTKVAAGPSSWMVREAMPPMRTAGRAGVPSMHVVNSTVVCVLLESCCEEVPWPDVWQLPK